MVSLFVRKCRCFDSKILSECFFAYVDEVLRSLEIVDGLNHLPKLPKKFFCNYNESFYQIVKTDGKRQAIS